MPILPAVLLLALVAAYALLWVRPGGRAVFDTIVTLILALMLLGVT